MKAPFKRSVIAVAIALTVLPLLVHPVSLVTAAREPLFTPSTMLASLGVFVLLITSAYSGVARKGNAVRAVLFACALGGAIFDARVAPIFVGVAAPLLGSSPDL